MRKRILIGMSLLALLTVAISIPALSMIMYQQLTEDMERELQTQAAYLQVGVSEEGIEYLDKISGEDKGSRITVIDPEGKVLFDNRAVAETMENHRERPEVRKALASGNGQGQDVRLSETVGSYTYYFAQRLDDGNILRVASTTDSILAALSNSAPAMVGIIFVILCIGVILSRHLTRYIVKPINDIDLENPTDSKVYDELAPLLIRIHHQNDSNNNQIRELIKNKSQFDEITGNMAEGLIVMDDNGNILSLNKSAMHFLGGDGRDSEQHEIIKQTAKKGKHLSVLNRSLSLQKMVNNALAGGKTEEILIAGEKQYQIRANPIIEDGLGKGTILLILDVTEQRKAEQIRKEFTANVSHELKTPLTTISGYAELIKDEVVKQEDIPCFAGKIYDESARLISLVEDIIKLSRLDEREVPFQMEDVDLQELSLEVKEKLSSLATQKKVQMIVEGEPVVVSGVRNLVEELITNLCDNAIKYNRENGTVRIHTQETKDGNALSIEDTGSGISDEHKDRIFERFYRADKSHSKHTGGTGLGLSIVKHIAGFHNAKLNLESTVGEGTRITVVFPKKQKNTL